MLLSIALVLMVGLLLSAICMKIKLPGVLGLLVTGVILGPYALNLLDPSIFAISADLRKIALVIILIRAGLGLNLSELKKLGRPAILMCFIPSIFELVGVVVFSSTLLGLSLLEAATMGEVLAAASPAIIIPRMVKLVDEGYGTKNGIPQLLLAGVSVENAFIVVVFMTFIGMMKGQETTLLNYVNIPLSILLGIGLGILIGFALAYFFKKVHIRDTTKVFIIISISFLLVVAEDNFKLPIKFSALVAILCIGVGLQIKRDIAAKRLSVKFEKIWLAAEIFLFVLVGATVNIEYVGSIGIIALIIIVCGLVFRCFGVFASLLRTPLVAKERLFAMIAYTPKATVQAAIGGMPLALGFGCGDVILAVAILSIALTAPLGAFAMDLSYKKLLNKDN